LRKGDYGNKKVNNQRVDYGSSTDDMIEERGGYIFEKVKTLGRSNVKMNHVRKRREVNSCCKKVDDEHGHVPEDCPMTIRINMLNRNRVNDLNRDGHLFLGAVTNEEVVALKGEKEGDKRTVTRT
jgi:hypothetical protein